ncbi:hypothetical protein [Criblamydia sequanensis]|uniref:Conserved putative membrane protein n=1 Tax=Candidatus Criblamydia sequanensis CRIB-18 TaxID=1437425 RepID=A0A090D0W5_9BACT|nr:hypothetical protein [Criblamydia sequanensis]CDR33525.1 Conserved putative membrane protein [Criblamydia sequanensis CRIB-18]
MKSIDTVSEWQKKQLERSKKLRFLGFFLIGVSIIASLFAFTFDWEAVQSFWEFSLSLKEREGYYMMSFVFAVMGLFCLKAGARE